MYKGLLVPHQHHEVNSAAVIILNTYIDTDGSYNIINQ